MKKLMILLALAAVSLFAVTACTSDTPSSSVSQPSVPQEPPQITLSADLQQGDSTIQIPEFKSPGDNPETRAINNKIRENHTKLYEEWKNRSDNSIRQLEIKTYSFADESYVQAVVTQLEFPTYGTQGDVFSYNYDIKHHKAITLSEILSETVWKFPRSEDGILASLTADLALQSDRMVERAEIQGFRLVENGVDCYAKVYFKGSGAQAEPYDMLYILHVDPSSETIPFEPYDGTTLIPTPEPPPEDLVSSVSSAS